MKFSFFGCDFIGLGQFTNSQRADIAKEANFILMKRGVVIYSRKSETKFDYEDLDETMKHSASRQKSYTDFD